jgi:indolepyruvate ferredoxin oxidoreductase alpha subunit
MDVFRAINEVTQKYGDIRSFSDIGCYTLGAYAPFNSIETCIDMGASITMAKGATDAGIFPAISVIGDSTFTHSGMTGLLDAITENTNMVLIISDNSAAAMTGGQYSPASERQIEKICLGLGVHPDHVRTIKPLPKNHQSLVDMIQEEVDYVGLSVIVARRECVRTLDRRMREKAAAKKKAQANEN